MAGKLPNEKEIRVLIRDACIANETPELIKRIKFKFSKNMTRCFGLAYVRTYLIKLSEPLWLRASEQERRQVVVHEACHIIAEYLARLRRKKISSHGKEWKACMVTAGYKPDRCHSVDRTGLVKQYVKYEAACKCSAVWVSHVRAGSVRRKRLYCKHCKANVKLTGKTFRPGEKDAMKKSS